MAKTTQKVKARKFVQDFLSGMSRDELMRVHELTPGSLDKLLGILEQKGILTRAQIHSVGLPRAVHRAHEVEETVSPPESQSGSEARPSRENLCPQCGAEVSKKALTCPECGHLLPGGKRWGAEEQDRSIFRRVPAWVIGCLIAVPAALVVVYIFLFMIYPMMEVASERKSQKARELKKAVQHSGKVGNTGPTNAAKKRLQEEQELRDNRAALKEEIEKLVQRRVFAGSGENYQVFQAGSAWSLLSDPDKYLELDNMRLSMKRAKVEVDFEVKDLRGSTVARVTEDAVILGSLPGPATRDKDPAAIDSRPGPKKSKDRGKVSEEALR